ncbi:hypothetical protein GQ55_1G122900 [Panicum hallii var. hallii]|uniref:F-box domain-containing protein n=1 Tax=Panicum hallii var. hallii TaxID=1504633 RepID=A0A2T7F4W7_9POAL|nr:hypothetical protein GQ55_1G122900 [Panicum hallii var. hallii]
MLLESTANCSSADSPEKSALLSFDLRSTLLDSILHIILSFLPAWHSVQMSALLWRWRDLWCSVPFINIDERSFDVRVYDETKVWPAPCGEMDSSLFLPCLRLRYCSTQSMCPSGCSYVQ